MHEAGTCQGVFISKSIHPDTDSHVLRKDRFLLCLGEMVYMGIFLEGYKQVSFLFRQVKKQFRNLANFL